MIEAKNYHGTAISISGCGFFFEGPSGTGKSAAALSCVEAARLEGRYAALIADDQVLLEEKNARIIAHAPQSIYGLCEIRGSEIVRVPSIGSGVIHAIVRLVDLENSSRLPPENEMGAIGTLTPQLPILRISAQSGLNCWIQLKYVAIKRGLLICDS